MLRERRTSASRSAMHRSVLDGPGNPFPAQSSQTCVRPATEPDGTREGISQIGFSGSRFYPLYTGADRVRYEYDAISRLTKEDWGHLSGGSWVSDNSTTWSYDWVGNRGTGSDFNQVDEYKAGNGYLYDKRGNVEYEPNSSGTPRTRYYYTDDNLLEQVDDVTTGGTRTTYLTWDADQRRVKLVSGRNTWYWVYDPAAGIPAVLLATDPLWDAPRYYVREPGGQLLACLDSNGSVWYYHFDALGSTVLITDGTGGVTTETAYGAWGSELVSCTEKPYHFVGQLGYYSHLTNQGAALSHLMQLGVRFYDRDIGRFTQRDAIPELSVSAYAYAGLNPQRFVDPSGLKKKELPKKIWDAGKHTAELFNYGRFCNDVWNIAQENQEDGRYEGDRNPGFDWVAGLQVGNTCENLKKKFNCWSHTKWNGVCTECVARSNGGSVAGTVKEWIEIYADAIRAVTGG